MKKFDAFKVFKKFNTMVEFEKNVKNALEFNPREFSKFCIEDNIKN